MLRAGRAWAMAGTPGPRARLGHDEIGAFADAYCKETSCTEAYCQEAYCKETYCKETYCKESTVVRTLVSSSPVIGT